MEGATTSRRSSVERERENLLLLKFENFVITQSASDLSFKK